MSGARSGGLRVFMVAGEPSGDLLGGRLMAALREVAGGPVEFRGVGGDSMRENGLDSLFPQADIALLGVFEILPKIPLLLRRWKETVAAVLAFKPDIVITIDSSGFNKGLAKRLIASGFNAPRLHYVAPMIWAWRPGRTRSMAELFDHLLTLFPFEPEPFRAAGLDATFVGHSALEAERGDGAAFRGKHGVDPGDPLIAVLPGSRRGELARLGPVFAEALRELERAVGGYRVAIPTVGTVEAGVREWARGIPGDPIVVTGTEARADAFAASDFALAASGTVTLELALAEVPMVVCYKVNALTAALAKRLIRTPFASLPNILAGEEIVPELLQADCSAERLRAALTELIQQPDIASRQRASFRDLRLKLGEDSATDPSRKAADVVLALVRERKPSSP